MHTGARIESRSTPVAVVLTLLTVLGAALVVVIAATAASAVAGDGAGIAAGIAAVIALLSFLTLRAYEPEEKIPWTFFVVVTILLTPAVPLVFLSWRWVRRRPTSPLAGPHPLPGF